MSEDPTTAVPTSRGLIDFDIGPLRRFRGKLDSLPTEPQTFGEGESARKSTRVTVNLGEVEVIECTEPYHFPTFQIQMTLSNRKKSRWGVLSESFNDLVDSQYTPEQLDNSSPTFVKPSDRMDLGKEGIGKMLSLVLADGEDGRPEPPMLWDGRATDETHPKGQDMPTPAWIIYEVEGIASTGTDGGVSATDLAEAMLTGKTLATFNKEALSNATIRNDAALLASIGLPVASPGNFANVLVKAGKFTLDPTTKIYTKVEAAV